MIEVEHSFGKDEVNEISYMAVKQGGKRKGAGRKPVPYKTKLSFRVQG